LSQSPPVWATTLQKMTLSSDSRETVTQSPTPIPGSPSKKGNPTLQTSKLNLLRSGPWMGRAPGRIWRILSGILGLFGTCGNARCRNGCYKEISFMILGTRPVRTMPLLVLGLLACVLVNAGGHPRVVVCYGMDGHVSLESTSGARCSQVSEVIVRPTAAPQRNVSLTAAAGHCAPCVDIPIPFSGFEQQPFLTQGPSVPSLVPTGPVSADASPVFTSLPAVRLVPPSSLDFSLALTSLRTVILLI